MVVGSESWVKGGADTRLGCTLKLKSRTKQTVFLSGRAMHGVARNATNQQLDPPLLKASPMHYELPRSSSTVNLGSGTTHDSCTVDVKTRQTYCWKEVRN